MTRSGGAALPIAGVSLLTLAMLGLAVIAGAATPSDSARADGLALDIPPAYLAAYHAASDRFALGAEGWSYLAAIGEVETDHGRSSAPGVRSGQNTNGCCAGPMQIHNGYGSGAGTWGRFKVDGDADGRMDIYDPEDAIATAAGYLRASGAPRDWRAAIFAYNHSGAYVSQVISRAAAYRQGEVSAPVTVVRGGSGAGLAPLPDFPGERCDVRIIPDVEFLVRAYGVAVTDCFGGPPHEARGRTSARPGGRRRSRRWRLGPDADPGDALRLEPSVCTSRLCRAGPVSGDPLQRLSGPRRSRSQHVAASAPVLAARARRAVHARSVGARPRSEVEAMTRSLGAPGDWSKSTSGCGYGGKELHMLSARVGALVSPIFLARVRDVKVSPDPSGLPGSRVLQDLVDGLAFWMLLAALAGILVGAGVWAISAHSNNHHMSARGRSGALVSACAALTIGAAGAIINFFADLGGKVK